MNSPLSLQNWESSLKSSFLITPLLLHIFSFVFCIFWILVQTSSVLHFHHLHLIQMLPVCFFRDYSRDLLAGLLPFSLILFTRHMQPQLLNHKEKWVFSFHLKINEKLLTVLKHNHYIFYQKLPCKLCFNLYPCLRLHTRTFFFLILTSHHATHTFYSFALILHRSCYL